jgi:hypothetical protein
MALHFVIEAECSSQREADAFGRHFLNAVFMLPDGRECRIGKEEIRCFEEGGHWRCCIVPKGASYGVPDTVLESDQERTDLALFLYERLRTAPGFRFAVVGTECAHFAPFDRGPLDPFPGLVVSDGFVSGHSLPPGFEPFSPGNLWVPITESSRV